MNWGGPLLNPPTFAKPERLPKISFNPTHFNNLD
jgi:hypothetical protein